MSNSAKLLLLIGVLVLAGIGVWAWQRFGPAIGVLVHDMNAARKAIASVPAARLERVSAHASGGRRVLVIEWRGSEDLDADELGAGCDAAWAELAANLQGQYDSVLIAAVVGRTVDVDLGVVSASYSNMAAAVHRTYGQPLEEHRIVELLAED